MPTTLSGLLLFVVLLLPGLAYVVRLERGTRPGKSSGITAFRETVTVVVASVLALSFVGLLFGVARTITPSHTPDVGRLVRAERGIYLRARYGYLGLWFALLLVAAVVVAYLAGRFDVARWLEDKVLHEPSGGQRPESAWYTVFEFQGARERKKYLVCRLREGTEVEGGLNSYNPIADEIADRELAVAPPYVLRRPNGEEQRYEAGAIIVAARDLVWLRVEFLTDAELASRVSPSAAPVVAGDGGNGG